MTFGDQQKAGSVNPSLAQRSRGIRLGIAGLIVLLCTCFTLLGDPEVCNEQLVPSTGAVTEVCSRLPASDPAVLGVIALVLLLLAPDVSEAGVVGLFTVKRQVEEAKADAARAQADAAHLGAELQNLQVVVSRIELVAAQQLHAQQSTTVNAASDTVAVLNWVAERTGLVGAGGGTAPDQLPDVAEARVALASRAFEALRGVLPPGWRTGTMLGIVAGDPRVVYAVDGPISADEAEDLLVASGLFDLALAGTQPVAQDATSDTPAVVAAPVLNAAGGHVGVLAAFAQGPEAAIDEQLAEQVTQASDGFARIVIDLLRLGDDSPHPGPTAPPRAD